MGGCSCRASAFVGSPEFPAAGTSLALYKIAIPVPFLSTHVFSGLRGTRQRFFLHSNSPDAKVSQKP